MPQVQDHRRAALPFLTAVIPCRNEERFIRSCASSLLASDYPSDRVEFLFVDGQSEDGTVDILRTMSAVDPRIRIVDNPSRSTPAAMNLGLAAAKGELVAILGAHASYASNYLSTLAMGLARTGAAATGGLVRTVPGSSGVMSEAIATSLGHPLGVGGASYKRAVTEPRVVDTVAFGCYRKETLVQMGGFDERLRRGQDLDMNTRIRHTGGRLYLLPGTVAEYFSRTGLWHFMKYRFRSGFWITSPMAFARAPFSIRHLVPAAFVLSLVVSGIAALFGRSLAPAVFIGILLLHLSAGVVASVHVAIARRRPLLVACLPAAFLAMHLSYGAGTICGLVPAALASLGRIPRGFALPSSKRIFDICASGIALAILSPLLVFVSLWIMFDSCGPAFFVQKRVGKGGRYFNIWKFRTMYQGADRRGVNRTSSADSRITPMGEVLRRFKIDELPQLFNVFNGTMSIVGPRPMVPEQVARWNTDELRALELSPGITDFASIRFHNESEMLLGRHGDVEAAYETLVRTEKQRLIKQYIEQRSMWVDLKIIFQTAKVIFWDRLFVPRVSLGEERIESGPGSVGIGV